MQAIATIIFILSVFAGGMTMGNEWHWTFVHGVITCLLLALAPYAISWAILKYKAPLMVTFCHHHPYAYLIEVGAWILLSLAIYGTMADTDFPREPSLIRLSVASIFAHPFSAFLCTVLYLDKRFQALAINEMRRMVGEMTGQRPRPFADEWRGPQPTTTPDDEDFSYDPAKFRQSTKPSQGQTETRLLEGPTNKKR